MKKLVCALLVLSISALNSCGQIDPNQIQSLEFVEVPSFTSGSKVMDQIYASFNATYPEREETLTVDAFNLDEELLSKFTFTLHKEEEEDNLIDQELESNQKYVLDATYEGLTASTTFVADEKVTLLKHEDLKATYGSRDKDTSPATGKVKMLVIPIELDGSWLDVWDTDYISKINDLYFGDDKLSLTSYYKDASFGAMEISGFVSEIYSYTAHTSDELQDNGGYEYLIDMMNKALKQVETNHPEIDWREYDLNKNDAIDNIHFVTNFNPDAYYQDTGKNPWATTLWPHMSNIYSTDGTHEKPSIRVYSCGVLSHLIDDLGESAITPIHEQGHIFGLPDYYDYGGLVDYIGSLDMQSGNCLDWNSYSKLSVGWVDSYVVKDECTITITPASKQGKCIIIPANYETFNNSAFDEYFLIELFSDYGNNAKFPYLTRPLGSGIRMYHVDARMLDQNCKETSNPNRGYQFIDNNSYDYTYSMYAGYLGEGVRAKKIYDSKLLTLIQKGGQDTFGDEDPNARHVLSKKDLFITGDVFTFNKYSKFLSKQGKTIIAMDNGEEFPYKIEFSEVNKDYARIKIIKQESQSQENK